MCSFPKASIWKTRLNPLDLYSLLLLEISIKARLSTQNPRSTSLSGHWCQSPCFQPCNAHSACNVDTPVSLQAITRSRSQAMEESKSLSVWLRDAGKKMLETDQQRQPLTDLSALKRFFGSVAKEKKAQNRTGKSIRDSFWTACGLGIAK